MAATVRLAIRRVEAPCLPRVPWWGVALGALWGAVLLAKVWLERRGAPPFDLCLFHRVSGHPCPTCGTTRAVLALARGDLWGALAWNPLSVLGLGALTLALVHRAATARRLELDADRAGRRLAWIAAALALALNWAWVWVRHGASG